METHEKRDDQARLRVVVITLIWALALELGAIGYLWWHG